MWIVSIGIHYFVFFSFWLRGESNEKNKTFEICLHLRPMTATCFVNVYKKHMICECNWDCVSWRANVIFVCQKHAYIYERKHTRARTMCTNIIFNEWFVRWCSVFFSLFDCVRVTNLKSDDLVGRNNSFFCVRSASGIKAVVSMPAGLVKTYNCWHLYRFIFSFLRFSLAIYMKKTQQNKRIRSNKKSENSNY